MIPSGLIPGPRFDRNRIPLPAPEPFGVSGPDGILQDPGVFHPHGGLQNLQPDEIAVMVVVDDDPGLVAVGRLDGNIAQDDVQHIHFRVVGDFHGLLLSARLRSLVPK